MRHLVLAWLLLASLNLWGFNEDRFQMEVNLARLERGLPPLRHLESLDTLCEDIMVYEAKRAPSDIEHFLMPTDLYFEALKQTYKGIPLSSKWYDLYEMLATRWVRGDMEQRLAYAWIGSKLHEWVFYHPRAFWYGYAVRQRGEYLYLVMYVAVIYINVDLKELE